MLGHATLTCIGENPPKMTDWPIELDQENELYDAWATDERQPQGLQFTPKVAPSFHGRTLWFAFEEVIDDCSDIKTLTPERQSPRLNTRLVGDAIILQTAL